MPALAASAPDVVLLVGGTDGGNTEAVLAGARMLAESRWATPVVVAGNVDAREEIAGLLAASGTPYVLADNVVPRIGVLAPDSARAAIRQMFLTHVIGGKHLSSRTDFAAMVRGATPDLVLTGVEVLAATLARDVVVVDVGGATTDVHSVVDLDPEDATLGREVVATTPVTRTVEGDLGMRWSAVSTVESGVAAGVLEADPALDDAARRRHDDPAHLPADRVDASYDVRIATAATVLAVRRHAGRSRVVLSDTGRVIERTGKDLREVDLLVGSGGVLRNAAPAVAEEILRSVVGTDPEGWQLPEATRARGRPRLRPRRRRPARRSAPRSGTHAGPPPLPPGRARRPPHVAHLGSTRGHATCSDGCAMRDARAPTRRPTARSSALRTAGGQRRGRSRDRCPGGAALRALCGAVARDPRRPSGRGAGDRRRPLELLPSTGAVGLRPGRRLVAGGSWWWRQRCSAPSGCSAIFAVVVLPLLVALFASALLTPAVHLLMRIGAGRRIASLVVVIFSIAAVGLLLTFVGQQIANGMDDLSNQVVDGVQQVRDWLRTGPLHLSDQDLQNTLKDLQDQIGANDGSIVSRASEVGATVGHIVAGFFIVLFGTYFFLADGPLIWTWFVRLFPRAARLQVDSSGRVGLALPDPVRPRDRPGRRHRRDRDHDRSRDPGRAVRAGDRRPGLPRRLRADDRRRSSPAPSLSWSRSSRWARSRHC